MKFIHQSPCLVIKLGMVYGVWWYVIGQTHKCLIFDIMPKYTCEDTSILPWLWKINDMSCKWSISQLKTRYKQGSKSQLEANFNEPISQVKARIQFTPRSMMLMRILFTLTLNMTKNKIQITY